MVYFGCDESKDPDEGASSSGHELEHEWKSISDPAVLVRFGIFPRLMEHLTFSDRLEPVDVNPFSSRHN